MAPFVNGPIPGGQLRHVGDLLFWNGLRLEDGEFVDTLFTILNFMLENLAAEFVVVVAGVIFARFIVTGWENWRYGRWRVIIVKENQTLLDRAISYPKAKEILDEPSELSVFLKGVVSPYGWINCDILDEGVKLGLLHKDVENRLFVINLDHNPQPKKPAMRAQADKPANPQSIQLHIRIEHSPACKSSVEIDTMEVTL